MDSERKRLPGIVRRHPVLAAEREGGMYRTMRTQAGEQPHRRPPAVTELKGGSMPAGDGDSGRLRALEVRLRQARARLAPYMEAVREHFSVHWTDGLLAIGFLAVGMLTAYLLLKG